MKNPLRLLAPLLPDEGLIQALAVSLVILIAAMLLAGAGGYLIGVQRTDALRAEADALRAELTQAHAYAEQSYYRGVYSICLYGLRAGPHDCNYVVRAVRQNNGFSHEPPGFVYEP